MRTLQFCACTVEDADIAMAHAAGNWNLGH